MGMRKGMLFLLAFCVKNSICGGAINITAMSFNVDCSICDLGTIDSWTARLKVFEYNPDLVAIQELLTIGEVEEILNLLGDHDAVYFSALRRLIVDPDATLFYRKSLFEVNETNVFWLSPTPDVPFSTGFANFGFQIPRMFVSAVLQHIPSSQQIFVSSSHFDNNSPSQELSASLVMQKLQDKAEKMPLIVMGDFNSQNCSDPSFGPSAHYNNSEAYKILTGSGGVPTGFRFLEAADVAHKILVINDTSIRSDYLSGYRLKETGIDRDSYLYRRSNNNQNENLYADCFVNQPPWQPNDEPVGGMRIDHIFLSVPNSTTMSWKADTYIVDDSIFPEDLPKYGYPSDHRPIVVTGLSLAMDENQTHRRET